MIYDDTFRQVLLALVGGIFLLVAIGAAAKPDAVANLFGLKLTGNNSYSEFHAIYFGLFLAQALLCLIAIIRVQDAMFGDLVALFLFAQPAGRFIAALRRGFPSGFLFILFMLELVGALLLISVRPSMV